MMIVLIKQGEIQWEPDHISHVKSKKDGWYEITIRRPPDDITLQQHKYYRGPIVGFIQKLIWGSYGESYTSDQIHALMKKLHGIEEMIGRTPVKKSMADYTKEDVNEYLERIERWVFDIWHVALPHPEDMK